MVVLSENQTKNILALLKDFKDFLETEEGKEWVIERKEKKILYSQLLSLEHLPQLSESEFSTIIKKLWATQVWTNKEWLVENIIKQNGGLERIKTELKELLYSDERPLNERYDKFREKIIGFGPSMLTEILAFVFPEKFCIWNEKPKTVLPFLNMKELLDDRVYKYQITGKEYEKCIEVLNLIKEELNKNGFPKADFIDVDLFLAFIFYEILPKREEIELRKEPKILSEELYPKPTIDVSKLTHEDVEALLIAIGNMLGYQTYTPDVSKKSELFNKALEQLATLKEVPPFAHEEILETVRNIDVIWFKEEDPTYCFEVEHTTDIIKGLVRLFQMRRFRFTKLYVIAPKEQSEKFLKEIRKPPFSQISNEYNFRSYEDLIRFYEITKKFYESKNIFLAP